MDERPSVDQYFMDMTHLVKSRGTCPRRQVGALVVKDKRVLTTGYNGAPRNFPHPTDQGCIRDELDIPSGMMADVCPCLHAEQNAILQAATTGVSIEGADIYCTTQPCTQCSRMIANCGIRRVIFEQEYADPLSIGLLVTAGVELWKWDADKRSIHRYGQHNTFEDAQDALRRRWAEQPPQRASQDDVRETLQDELDVHEEHPTRDETPGQTREALARAPTAPGVPQADGPEAGDEATGEPSPPEEQDAHDEAPSEVQVEGLRHLESEEDREATIRNMIASRKQRLQRALDESK